MQIVGFPMRRLIYLVYWLVKKIIEYKDRIIFDIQQVSMGVNRVVNGRVIYSVIYSIQEWN